jgi:hypothetical protein
MRWISIRGHHEDEVSLPGGVPAYTDPNFKSHQMSLDQGTLPMMMSLMLGQWSKARCHNRDTPNELGGVDIESCTRIQT